MTFPPDVIFEEVIFEAVVVTTVGAEVETLLGDASKARTKLGWTPATTFKTLVAEMAREDFNAAKRDALVREHGYKAPDHHE